MVEQPGNAWPSWTARYGITISHRACKVNTHGVIEWFKMKNTLICHLVKTEATFCPATPNNHIHYEKYLSVISNIAVICYKLIISAKMNRKVTRKNLDELPTSWMKTRELPALWKTSSGSPYQLPQCHFHIHHRQNHCLDEQRKLPTETSDTSLRTRHSSLKLSLTSILVHWCQVLPIQV